MRLLYNNVGAPLAGASFVWAGARPAPTNPLFILGSGLGDSVEFGISGKSSKKMANYYEAEYYEVKNATHPGIIMGKYAGEAMEKIENWLHKI